MVSKSSQAAADPVEFVRKHGVVLESARGHGASLAEAVAGETIRGNWWGHERRREIFRATRKVRECDEVLVCRLLDGKVTYVHRRLWPALVRLRASLDAAALGALHEEHTNSGAHRLRVTPFPRWVPAEVRKAALALPESAAWRLLDAWIRPAVRVK
jgi:hypothetical protein